MSGFTGFYITNNNELVIVHGKEGDSYFGHNVNDTTPILWNVHGDSLNPQLSLSRKPNPQDPPVLSRFPCFKTCAMCNPPPKLVEEKVEEKKPEKLYRLGVDKEPKFECSECRWWAPLGGRWASLTGICNNNGTLSNPIPNGAYIAMVYIVSPRFSCAMFRQRIRDIT